MLNKAYLKGGNRAEQGGRQGGAFQSAVITLGMRVSYSLLGPREPFPPENLLSWKEGESRQWMEKLPLPLAIWMWCGFHPCCRTWQLWHLVIDRGWKQEHRHGRKTFTKGMGHAQDEKLKYVWCLVVKRGQGTFLSSVLQLLPRGRGSSLALLFMTPEGTGKINKQKWYDPGIDEFWGHRELRIPGRLCSAGLCFLHLLQGSEAQPDSIKLLLGTPREDYVHTSLSQ